MVVFWVVPSIPPLGGPSGRRQTPKKKIFVHRRIKSKPGPRLKKRQRFNINAATDVAVAKNFLAFAVDRQATCKHWILPRLWPIIERLRGGPSWLSCSIRVLQFRIDDLPSGTTSFAIPLSGSTAYRPCTT